MALLPEAIRSSDTQSAIYRSPHGYSVIVKRVTGREEPDSEAEFDAMVEWADQRPGQWRIAALTLVEAYDRMRGLGLADFDPLNDAWQPATLPSPEPPVSPEERKDYLTDYEKP
ncbi:MAG TPA: hypothetical protein VF120_05565 [Ktedonobacterales bacterium]